MQFRQLTGLSFTLVILFVFYADSLTAQEAPKVQVLDDAWQTIWIANQRIGYAHTTMYRQADGDQAVIVTDNLMFMKMTRFGQSITMKQTGRTEEAEDGTLLRFTSVLDNPPNSKSTTSGHFEQSDLVVSATVGGNTTTKSIPEMEGVSSSVWPERFLAEGNLRPGQTKEFQVFDPQLGRKVRVTVEHAAGNDPDSGQHEVVISQHLTGGPTVSSTLIFDQDWNMLKSTTPLVNMEVRSATEEEALKPVDDSEFDLAVDMMIPVKGLTNVQSAKSITYRIHVDGSNPTEIFDVTDQEALRTIDANTLELTVSSSNLAPRSDDHRSSSNPSEEYLLPTPLIESENPLIEQLAEQGAGGARQPAEIASNLTQFVNGLVKEKNFSTSLASAVETARSKTGDCTEHAVLLAALLRAREIPSRVVIGFVYAEQYKGFAGHMWTEAWIDGKWLGCDATRSDGQVSPGHLAISRSALADQGNAPAAEFLPIIHLLGRTEIDVVKIVR